MKPEAIFISVCRSALSAGPGPSVLHFVYTSSISLFPHILDHNFSLSPHPPQPQGVNWKPWKGHLLSLDFTEMKIRPAGALSSRKRRSLMAELHQK